MKWLTVLPARFGRAMCRRRSCSQAAVHTLVIVALAAVSMTFGAHAHAVASTLYRCAAKHGANVFTNRPDAYTDCRPFHSTASSTRSRPNRSNRRPRLLAGSKLPIASQTSAQPPHSGLSQLLPATKTPPPVAIVVSLLRVPAISQATASPQPLSTSSLPTIRVLRVSQAAVAPVSAPPQHSARVGLDRGAIYAITSTDGSTKYTNIASQAQGHRARILFTYIMRTCVACAVHSSIDWATTPLYLRAYSADIRQASHATGLDEAMLRAVIHAESGFNHNAVSVKGASGLMQLMPDTASALDVSNVFDATQNIYAGARYLAQLLQAFHGNATLAIAAYNAGATAVHKYASVPPFPETQVYVKRVELLRERYSRALGGY